MLVFCETHPLMRNSSLCSSVTGLRDSLNIFLCHSVLDVSSSPAIRRLIRVRRVKIATAGQTRSYLWNVSVCVSALIKYIRPVFVSRSDQDSRRKTVEEIKRRARSGGDWPQVQLTDTLCFHLKNSLQRCAYQTFRDLLTSDVNVINDNIWTVTWVHFHIGSRWIFNEIKANTTKHPRFHQIQ